MQKAASPRAQGRKSVNKHIPSQECSHTRSQSLSELKPATSAYPQSKTSSCPTPQKKLNKFHMHRLCSYAENLKGNLSVLPPSSTHDDGKASPA